MFPLLTLDEPVELVHTEDPSVALAFVQAPPAADDDPPPEPRRKPREPGRWVRADDPNEVELVGPEALRLTVRVLNTDEQFQVCPNGLADVGRIELARTSWRALRIALIAIAGVDRRGRRVDARTPEAVAQARNRLTLPHAVSAGSWVLDHSLLPPDPFVGAASPPSATSPS